MILNIVWSFICAIANRIRGGFLGPWIKKIFPWWATTPSRLFVSAVLAIPVFFNISFVHGIIFLLLQYVGFVFRWSPWNLMKNPLTDIPLLSLRGLVVTFPAGFFLASPTYSYCGLSMGIIYFLTWRYPPYYKDCTGYVWNGSDWGEFVFGALLGYFILIAV